MEKEPETCKAIMALLGGDGLAAFALNDGWQLSRTIDAGLPLDEKTVSLFLSPLSEASTLVVGDGMLIQPLRDWLPGKKIMSKLQSRDSWSTKAGDEERKAFGGY